MPFVNTHLKNVQVDPMVSSPTEKTSAEAAMFHSLNKERH